MNSLWPASTRASCLNPRTIFQSCHKIDSLAARLAQRTLRSHSISTILIKRRHNVYSGQGWRAWQFSNAAYKLPAGIRTFATQRIIEHFADLPEGYRDEEGLMFRTKDLTREETTAIFGKNMIDANTANRMLRILHGRRVAGTLGNPSFIITAYEAKAVESGMDWLRKNVPVDEIECAGLRAEKELEEMEYDIVSDSERLGLYQPNSGNEKNVYGDSVIDRVRKANEAKLDAKEKAEKEELSQADEIRQNTGTLQTTRPRSQVELRTPGQHPRLKYYLERSKVAPDVPPNMTKWERLFPSFLLTLAVVAGSTLFASVYVSPKRESRAWPDMPPAAATIISIILLNAIVLGAWRIPPAFRMLNKYFLVMPAYPRALSLIGNVFSHQTIKHFTWNMIVIWFVGVRLHEEIGRGNFIAVYASAGAVGSFVSLSSWVLRNNFVSSSLGASGAICGIVATYLLLNSSEKVTLFGFFPPEGWPSVSAIVLLGLMVSADVFGLRKGNKLLNVDHWAHLGGYAAGAVAAGVVRRQRMIERQREVERRKGLGIVDRIREGRL